MKKHVSHVLTTLNLNNRVQIALLVHDADLTILVAGVTVLVIGRGGLLWYRAWLWVE